MSETIHHYAAVAFDFDGTLADSYSAIASSVNHVRAQRGLGKLSVAEVKQHVGRGAEYLLTHTIPNGNLAEDLACYRVHHPTVMRTMTELLPGAATLVLALHQRGVKVGLCSNKPRLFSQELLEYLKLAAAFDVVLGPEEVPHPKPAPDMLLRAVEHFAVAKERTLYVGDMLVDIQTARAAGVRVWAVATGSEDRAALVAARPDRLLDGLLEIVAELGPL
ncbi:MAG: HAD family hydrolase [Planctomycetes bacterium]|nr:HAD family hydrolase [Planctomycetota bacterium]